MPDFNIAINLKANDLGASQVIRGLTGNVRKLKNNLGQPGAAGFLEASAFRQAGTAVTRFGALARLGIGSTVKAAATLEQRLANVRAVTSDARNIAVDPQAAENFRQLSDLAKELGATTEFTAAQAADGLKFLGIAGFNTKQQLAALPPILDLATAAETDLGKTSDFVSDIMGGFGIEADKTRQVTDVLAKTFTESNTTLSFLSRSLFKVGPLAKTAGVGITEMSAAAGFLGSQGIKGAEAGTILRNSLLAMTGKPSKDAKEALRSIGLSSEELKKTLDAQGFEGAFLKISEGLGKLGGSEQLQVAEAIFGKRTASAATALAKGFKTGELNKFRQGLEKAGGTTTEVASIMRDTAENRFKLFESAVDGLKVQLGNEFLPVLQEMLPDILKLAQSTAEWIRENRSLLPTLAKAAVGLTAISTVAGPLLTTVGTLKSIMHGLGIATSFASGKFPILGAAMGKAQGPLSGLTGAAGKAGGALGVLSAGLVGFEIGSFIDQTFGISDALAGLNNEIDRTLQRGKVAKLGDFSDVERAELESAQKAMKKAQADLDKANAEFFTDNDEPEERLIAAQRRIAAINAKVSDRVAREQARGPKQIDLGVGRNSKAQEAEKARMAAAETRKVLEGTQVPVAVTIKVDKDGRFAGAEGPSIGQALAAGQIAEGA